MDTIFFSQDDSDSTASSLFVHQAASTPRQRPGTTYLPCHKTCLLSYKKIIVQKMLSAKFRSLFLSNSENFHVTSCLRFQVFEVKQAVYNFVGVGVRGRGGCTPLHLACSKDSSSVGRYPICVFPSVPALELLLECGADPNALDHVNLFFPSNIK